MAEPSSMSSKDTPGPSVQGFTQAEGGCLCGALRYQLNGRLVDAGYCHCRLCQRSSGAPVMAWLTTPNDTFVYTRGEPQVYHSSASYQREFCGQCGSQIAFRRIVQPRTVDVTIASLDQPEQVVPEYHIWVASQIPWFEVKDQLCRYLDAGPDSD